MWGEHEVDYILVCTPKRMPRMNVNANEVAEVRAFGPAELRAWVEGADARCVAGGVVSCALPCVDCTEPTHKAARESVAVCVRARGGECVHCSSSSPGEVLDQQPRVATAGLIVGCALVLCGLRSGDLLSPWFRIIEKELLHVWWRAMSTGSLDKCVQADVIHRADTFARSAACVAGALFCTCCPLRVLVPHSRALRGFRVSC